MPRPFWSAMVTALIATVATATPPQGVVQSSKRTYECSASAGKFEQAEIGHLAGGNILTGRIKFLEGYTGAVPNSAGALGFRLADGSVAGVFLTILHGDRRHAYLMLQTPGPDRHVLLGRVNGDEAIVRVMLDEAGVLSVRSNWMSRRVQLDNPKVIGRVVHCQSGRFRFLVGSY